MQVKGYLESGMHPSRPHESFRKRDGDHTRMDRMWLRCHGILGESCPSMRM